MNIVFKCEASLFEMVRRGEKQFDMRRYDLTDERIHALSWFGPPVGYTNALDKVNDRQLWQKVPDVPGEPLIKHVSFKNKATGESITLRYKGMEFAPWAPGWCFLILGGLVVDE